MRHASVEDQRRKEPSQTTTGADYQAGYVASRIPILNRYHAGWRNYDIDIIVPRRIAVSVYAPMCPFQVRLAGRAFVVAPVGSEHVRKQHTIIQIPLSYGYSGVFVFVARRENDILRTHGLNEGG